MILSPEQIRAVIVAATAAGDGGKFVFVTGKAGTGKSTTLRTMRESGMVLAVCAPTGLAALNVGGITMHSAFGLPMGPAIADNAKPLDHKKAGVFKAADAIVIDEISMVRADMLDYADAVLRRTFDPDKRFGGKTVIAYGDMWQLEPVTKPGDWKVHEGTYRSPFWFDAKVFTETVAGLLADVEPVKIQTVELNEVFRQAGDQRLIDALNLIRVGDPAGLDYINQIGVRPMPPEDLIPFLCLSNDRAAQINRAELAKLPGEAQTYYGELTGDMGRDLPAEVELQIKAGARVMCIRNTVDMEQRVKVVNGDVGEVTGFHNGFPVVEFPDGRHWDATPATWSKKKYEISRATGKKEVLETTTGSFKQVPLKLAWGITVHKSQGQTLQKACIDFESPSRTHGQTYVALSRLANGDGLYLRRALKPADLIINPRVAEFARGDHEPAKPRFAGLFA